MLGLYTKLVGPIPFFVNSVNTNKSDSFVVSGEGEVSQAPDTAEVSLGVQSQGNTVQVAQDALNKSINAVTAAVKQQGVAEADIQTQNYSVNPNYDYNGGAQKITGYQAGSNLRIKVKDISKVNAVIDAGTAAGANQVGGVNFTVADPTALESQARDKAIANAKQRAEAAAKAAGFRLGRMVNYSESTNRPGGPELYAMGSSANLKTDAVAPTQVQPGSSTVSITVNLSYEIY